MGAERDREFLNNHIDIIKDRAAAWAKSCPEWIPHEDRIAIGVAAAFRARGGYRANKGANLRTLVRTYVDRALSRAVRKARNTLGIETLADDLDFDPFVSDFATPEECLSMKETFMSLTEVERRAIGAWVFGYDRGETAAFLGVSKQRLFSIRKGLQSKYGSRG